MEEKKFTETVRTQGFTKSAYFFQILKIYLDDIKFLIDMLQYISNFASLLSFSSLFTRIQHLLAKLLALKGNKVTKKKCRLPKPRFDL